MSEPAEWIVDRPKDVPGREGRCAPPLRPVPLLMLAHGAGAGADAPFLARFGELMVARGVMVARFNFTYMARAISQGRRIAPPRAERLMEEYRARVAHWREQGFRPVVGGKSLGGRVASMLAQELFEAGDIRGLVCLGYPFHPPGRPGKLRIDHLKSLQCPTLICQGARDPFGTRAEVEALPLSPAIRLCWLPDGDHDFKPRVKSGETWGGNLALAADACADFLHGLP